MQIGFIPVAKKTGAIIKTDTGSNGLHTIHSSTTTLNAKIHSHTHVPYLTRIEVTATYLPAIDNRTDSNTCTYININKVLGNLSESPDTFSASGTFHYHYLYGRGFGQISKNFIYINVGTGIAVGTVINGRQIRGSHFNAGEVGHVRVGVNLGIKCGCGRMDCVEAIAAGIGFDNCARLLRNRYETNLHIPAEKGERVLISEVFALSQKGDPLCVALVENASEALANLIMNLVRVTDPDTVVLGGGIVFDVLKEQRNTGHETPVLVELSVLLLIPLMYFSMGHMMWGWPLPKFFEGNHIAMGLVQLLLTIAVMVINQKFFISGFKSLWHKAPNMDTLVTTRSAHGGLTCSPSA